jgi:hypothetical protein
MYYILSISTGISGLFFAILCATAITDKDWHKDLMGWMFIFMLGLLSYLNICASIALWGK